MNHTSSQDEIPHRKNAAEWVMYAVYWTIARLMSKFYRRDAETQRAPDA